MYVHVKTCCVIERSPAQGVLESSKLLVFMVEIILRLLALKQFRVQSDLLRCYKGRPSASQCSNLLMQCERTVQELAYMKKKGRAFTAS
jgi:hypothetical protein